MMHNNFNPFGDLPEMPTPQPDNLTDEERMQLATATLLGGCATTAAAERVKSCSMSSAAAVQRSLLVNSLTANVA